MVIPKEVKESLRILPYITSRTLK
ncbi:hypothetical protein [Sulfurisphaera ohwakuensis]